MKIKKPKRIMSLFLAALMCVTSLVGIGTTAYAAEETDDVYLISYPRDGDSNYNAEWGHGSLTFMNGWKTGTSVIQPSVRWDRTTGISATVLRSASRSRPETALPKRARIFGTTTLRPITAPFLLMILSCSSVVSSSTAIREQSQPRGVLRTRAAISWLTQSLHSFSFGKPSSASVMKTLTRSAQAARTLFWIRSAPNHPLYDKIMSYYNSMAASVQKHSKLPSFLTKTPGSAQEIELEWDGSKYTVTLTDSNNVLSGYKFSSNDSGVQFSVSGNKLTITAEKAPSDGLTITAEKTAQRKGVITWTDGIYGPNGGVQDTVTYAQTVNDPVKGFLKLKVSYGSAKIVKTSEDGKVDGISFRIQGNGIDKTVKTENGGQIQVDNLMPGSIYRNRAGI